MSIEFTILDFIQNNLRTPIGDIIMPFISSFGDGGKIWIIIAVVLLIKPDTRKAGGTVLLAIGIDVVLCNGILKPMIARIRPCDVNTAIHLLVPRPDDFSFPSGHTAASFAAASALYFEGVKRLCKPAFLLAVLIAFSRLYLYVHYPTDVLAGIAIGVLAGFAGYMLMEVIKLWKVRTKKV